MEEVQRNQVTYYTDLIKKKHEWILADINADEAITGTQVAKREDFQRMINDCMNGDIDMVITNPFQDLPETHWIL